MKNRIVLYLLILTLTIPSILADTTGNLDPTANDGGWPTNPNNAHADGGGYAETTTLSDTVDYYDYDIPTAIMGDINDIDLRVDAWYDEDSPGNCFKCTIKVRLSWDGGTSWTTQKSQSITTSETTYTFSGWSHSFTADELTNSNFRVEIQSGASAALGNIWWRVDWAPVDVDYEENLCQTNSSWWWNVSQDTVCDDMTLEADYINIYPNASLKMSGTDLRVVNNITINSTTDSTKLNRWQHGTLIIGKPWNNLGNVSLSNYNITWNSTTNGEAILNNKPDGTFRSWNDSNYTNGDVTTAHYYLNFMDGSNMSLQDHYLEEIGYGVSSVQLGLYIDTQHANLTNIRIDNSYSGGGTFGSNPEYSTFKHIHVGSTDGTIGFYFRDAAYGNLSHLNVTGGDVMYAIGSDLNIDHVQVYAGTGTALTFSGCDTCHISHSNFTGSITGTTGTVIMNWTNVNVSGAATGWTRGGTNTMVFRNSNITGTTSGAAGVAGGNTAFIDSVIYGGTQDIQIFQFSGATPEVYFYNATAYPSKITFVAFGVGFAEISWPLGIKVEDTEGNGIEGATVLVYTDIALGENHTNTTDADGYIRYLNITENRIDNFASSNHTANWTINVSIPGYKTQQSLNVSGFNETTIVIDYCNPTNGTQWNITTDLVCDNIDVSLDDINITETGSAIFTHSKVAGDNVTAESNVGAGVNIIRNSNLTINGNFTVDEIYIFDNASLIVNISATQTHGINVTANGDLRIVNNSVLTTTNWFDTFLMIHRGGNITIRDSFVNRFDGASESNDAHGIDIHTLASGINITNSSFNFSSIFLRSGADGANLSHLNFTGSATYHIAVKSNNTLLYNINTSQSGVSGYPLYARNVTGFIINHSVGTFSASSSNFFFRLLNVTHSIIENTNVSDYWADVIHITDSYNITIRNFQSHNNSQCGGSPHLLEDSDLVYIDNSNSTRNINRAAGFGFGIWIAHNANITINNSHQFNNIFDQEYLCESFGFNDTLNLGPPLEAYMDEWYVDVTSTVHLVNTTGPYLRNNVSLYDGSNFSAAWPISLYIQDGNGNPVESALADWFSTNILENGSNTTGASGYIRYSNITEYFKDTNGPIYYTNYTLNVTHAGYNFHTSSHNWSGPNETIITLYNNTCSHPKKDKNWRINLADNCIVNHLNFDMGTGNITTYNSGSVTFENSNVTTMELQINRTPSETRRITLRNASTILKKDKL